MQPKDPAAQIARFIDEVAFQSSLLALHSAIATACAGVNPGHVGDEQCARRGYARSVSTVRRKQTRSVPAGKQA